MFGLAEAMHSNRTLIWGKFIPNLFTRSKDKSCYDPTNGGLYDCFFQKISTCSFKDVSFSERFGLGYDGYDEQARVMLQQPRRGLSAYFPTHPYRDVEKIRLLWPASLAAYAFRFLSQPHFPPPLPAKLPQHCAHIRHGDVKFLDYVYQNKGVYDFEDYFVALRAMRGPRPPTIYIATDSVHVDKQLKIFQDWWMYQDSIISKSSLSDKSAKTASVGVEDSPLSADSVDPLPSTAIIALPRLRTKYGSHVTAARGGCQQGSCALPYQHFDDIKRVRSSYTESDDVYQVVRESLEDIYILTHCSAFVGQASSHLTTISIFLMLYNMGVESYALENIVLLDREGIANGQYESSYLLGTYNTQMFLSADKGWERYASLQMRFGDTDTTPPTPPDLHADPDLLFLPTLSYETFDKIVDRWTAPVFSDAVCNNSTDLQMLINHGVDQSEWHPAIALACWKIALSIIKINPDLDKLVEEVVTENMAAVRDKHFQLYYTKLI
jgi:hypothetical protein